MNSFHLLLSLTPMALGLYPVDDTMDLHRFFEFRAAVWELAECNDVIGEQCEGLTIDHPLVTLLDTDGAPFSNHPVMAGILRLIFHDCQGIDPAAVLAGDTSQFTDGANNGVAGGCNGCIAVDFPGNFGLLDAAILPLESICNDYSDIITSTADCWALAATFVLENSARRLSFHLNNGQNITPALGVGDIPYLLGREDCENGYENGDVNYPFDNPVGVTFPVANPLLGWQELSSHLQDRFRFGGVPSAFTNRDVVSLMSGGHSLGHAHEKITGFSGSIDFGQDTLDNEFPSILLGEDWFFLEFDRPDLWPAFQNTSKVPPEPLWPECAAFPEDRDQCPLVQHQTLEHNIRNLYTGVKSQWATEVSFLVILAFPTLLTATTEFGLPNPITKLGLKFNTDMSMVYDLSHYIDNGLENDINCVSRADQVCTLPFGQQPFVTYAPRGNRTALWNHGVLSSTMGEFVSMQAFPDYCANSGDPGCVDCTQVLCCEAIQCPRQCNGGQNQWATLRAQDYATIAASTQEDCPAILVQKYSMFNSVQNVLPNRNLGIDFSISFTKMITVGYQGAGILESVDVDSRLVIGYKKNVGQQCTGTGTDVLRDFEGDEDECKEKCREKQVRDLGGCIGFIHVNSGSQFANKCYFRGGELNEPFDFTGDDRDCFEPTKFQKVPGMQCWGSGTDVERDFVGNEQECADRCAELDGCVGFIRVNSGSQYAGKCYFRSGVLQEPIVWNGDDRDCYIPEPSEEPEGYVKYDGQQCTGSAGSIVRDYFGTAEECGEFCDNLAGCSGFIRVNSGSQFAGKCYFRGGTISTPSPYTNDDRDCYLPQSIGVPAGYTKYDGQQCTGSIADIERDFVGDVQQCADRCDELTGCVGFVRVNSGSQFAGKCYFRGGTISTPSPYNNDDRDCFIPNGGAPAMEGDEVIDKEELITNSAFERSFMISLAVAVVALL